MSDVTEKIFLKKYYGSDKVGIVMKNATGEAEIELDGDKIKFKVGSEYPLEIGTDFSMGYNWKESTGEAIVSGYGYVVNHTAKALFTIDDTGFHIGDTFEINGYSANKWRITMGVDQKLQFGTIDLTNGNWIEPVDHSGNIEIRYLLTDTGVKVFSVIDEKGNFLTG